MVSQLQNLRFGLFVNLVDISVKIQTLTNKKKKNVFTEIQCLLLNALCVYISE